MRINLGFRLSLVLGAGKVSFSSVGSRGFGAVTVAVATAGWFSHWGLALSVSRFEAGSKVCNLKGYGRCACFGFELDDVAEP